MPRVPVTSESGRLIYEWDQTIDEVNVFFQIPEGTQKSDLEISFQPKMFKIGIKGNPPYLALPPWAPVEAAACLWWVENFREISVQFQKVREEEVWPAAFEGHAGNLKSFEDSKKKILLEKFQREHAGFDFSDAEVSGAVPNPRTFMK